MISHPFEHVAVVPIFVNAGTALLPAIIAPVASAAALIMKPRELGRAMKKNPLIPLGLVAAAVGIYFLCAWLLSPHAAAHPAGPAEAAQAPSRTDWTAIALEIIRNEKNGGATVVTPTTNNQPKGPVQFRGSFARAGSDGTPGPVKLSPVWSYNQPSGAFFASSPAVVGDRIYGAWSLSDVGGFFGGIFCLDAKSGSQIWLVDKMDGEDCKAFFSSPAISGDGKYLVIGQGLHTDADCQLICLETDTGKVHWKIKTPLHIESSPAIFGDMVVAGAGAIEDEHTHKPTGDPGHVIAVRISDGKELWRAKVNDPESSPAIGEDGTIYIGSGFNGNAVVALNPADGSVKWRRELEHPVTSAITLVDGLVIAGGGNSDYINVADHPAGMVVALDAKSGEVKWKRDMGQSVLGAIAASGGKLYAPILSGEVAMLNESDGQIVWRQHVSKETPIGAGPAVAGGVVYAVAKDGVMAILDAKDGKVIEKLMLNEQGKPGTGLSFSSPMVANGCVYVGSETGGMRCLGGK